MVEARPAPAPEEPQSKCTPEFDRFCADCLEEGSTFTIDPTPAFEQWKAWCAKRDIAHGSQKRFGGMMGARAVPSRRQQRLPPLHRRARQAVCP